MLGGRLFDYFRRQNELLNSAWFARAEDDPWKLYREHTFDTCGGELRRTVSRQLDTIVRTGVIRQAEQGEGALQLRRFEHDPGRTGVYLR